MDHYTVEEKQVGPFTVETWLDQDAGQFENPAQDFWDQGVQFVTWERNSTLSDLHSWEDKEAVVRIAEKDGCTVFSLYKYEHGAVAYKTSPFSCPWDSGQVGFVIVAADYDDPQNVAEACCKAVTGWCNGEYYGFSVKDEDDEILECCGGFDDSDWALAEGVDQANYCLEEYYEKQAKELEATRPDLYEVA